MIVWSEISQSNLNSLRMKIDGFINVVENLSEHKKCNYHHLTMRETLFVITAW